MIQQTPTERCYAALSNANRIVFFVTCVLLIVTLVVDPRDSTAQSWTPLPDTDKEVTFFTFSASEDGEIWIPAQESGLYRYDPASCRASEIEAPSGLYQSVHADSARVVAIVRLDSNPNRPIVVRSVDDGISWDVIEFDDTAVAPVRLLRDDAGDCYIACAFGRLYREDPASDGAVWSLYEDFEQANADSLLQVLSIAGTSGNLLVSLVDLSEQGSGEENAILVEEPGKGWRDVSPLLDNSVVWSVARTASGRIYVSTARSLFPVPIYYSDNDGASWTEESVMNRVYPRFEQASVFASGTGSVVYAAERELLYSNDNGRTFSRTWTGGSILGGDVGRDGRIRITAYRTQPLRIVLFEENKQRTALLESSVTPLHIGTSELSDGQLRVIHRRDDELFVVRNNTELWKYDRNREVWDRFVGLPVDTIILAKTIADDLIIGGSDAVFTLDRSESWTRIDSGAEARDLFTTGGGYMVIDRTYGPIEYRYPDGTVVRPPAQSPAAAKTTRPLGILRDGSLLAQQGEKLVALPTLSDGWIELPLPVDGAEAVICVNNADMIVAADRSSAWISRDGATSWSRTNWEGEEITGLYLEDVNDWAIDTRIALTTSNGIWSSRDLGQTWNSLTGNLPRCEPISSFAFGPRPGSVFAAVERFGIYSILDWNETSVDDEEEGARDGTSPFEVRTHGDDRITIVFPRTYDMPHVIAADLRGNAVRGILRPIGPLGDRFIVEWKPERIDEPVLVIRVDVDGMSVGTVVRLETIDR